jgi:hypothetical protein
MKRLSKPRRKHNMLLSEFKALKDKELVAQAATTKELEALSSRLGEFIRGFEVEPTAWITDLDYVPKPEPGKKNLSIHHEHGGLQMQLVMRAKAHGDDPKKFAVVQVDILDAGEQCFVRCQMHPRGNDKLNDLFKARLTEYVQGELGIIDNVQVIE